MMTEYFPPEFAPPRLASATRHQLLDVCDHPRTPPRVLPDGSLSLREAARRAGVSSWTIRRQVRAGKLRAYLCGDRPGIAHLRVWGAR